MGNNITCTIRCYYRTAATLYALETWFVSGINNTVGKTDN